MAYTGILKTNAISTGVSAEEVVAIAKDNKGVDWTIDGCAAFVSGVTNLAGAPFFNEGYKIEGNDPTKPLDDFYVVPHSPGIKSSTDNIARDGWVPVSTATSVAALQAILQPGDVVRVYKAGNADEETNFNGGFAAHSLIVSSVNNGQIKVIDNWGKPSIHEHDWSDIVNAFAPQGYFEAAFVSRIDQNWVDTNASDAVAGIGFGDFSQIVPSGGASSSTDDVVNGQSIGDAENTLSKATGITLDNNGDAVINGSVGYALDTNDYIQFVPDASATGTLELTNLTGNIYLRLFEDGKQVATAGGNNANDKSITYDFKAGSEYTAKADPFGDTVGTYTLDVDLWF